MNIKWSYSKHCVEDAFSVRKKVFTLEQGFSEELEFDDIDDFAHHVVVYDGSKPIATARLFDLEGNGVYHIGRVCVDSDYRGQHIGEYVMKAVIEKAVELKGNQLELSAQVTVQPFYEKLGFCAVGEEYLDEHCPHIKMVMSI